MSVVRRSLALVDRARVFRTATAFLALVLVWVGFGIGSEYFLTQDNILNIFQQSANVVIVAAGLTVVLIVAEIDLSVGSMEALSGAICAVVLIKQGIPMALGVALSLMAAIVLGMVSGAATAALRIPSFVATLAMLGIAQGAAFLMVGGSPIYGFHDSFRWIGIGRWGQFPVAAAIAIAIVGAVHLLLYHTRLGTHMFAVGGNAQATALQGIKVNRVKTIALAISALTAGVGGVMLSARLNAGDGRFGAGDLLVAVAAVVIGGTSLFGGVGSVIASTIGVLLIVSIQNGLILLNVQDFWQQIVIGVMILAAMLVDRVADSDMWRQLRPRRRAEEGSS
jgi:ribose/xylose/arabinose/galactoside ABC-type transport system permease subunit